MDNKKELPMISKTFTIDAQQLSRVELKLAALNKKAVKLGFAQAVISSSVSFMEEFWPKSEPYPIFFPKITLTVDAEELRFGDYTFVAALDHSIGKTPIVKSKAGEEVPEVYFSAVSTTCEHCNIKRHRNNTYVFKDANGYKQVGSTCLKEFFGIDPTKNLDWFGAFYTFDEEFFERGTRPVHYEGVEVSLAYALAIVAQHGFVSKKASSAYHEASGGTAWLATTADRVQEFLLPAGGLRNAKLTDAEIQYRREIRAAAEANKEAAKALIVWGVDYFSKEAGEYSHNMTKFLSEVAIPAKYMGYLVSVIAAKNRYDGIVAAKETRVEKNEFIGAVGDKVTLTVKVNKVIPIAGNYGTSYGIMMTEVDTGNHVVWFASGSPHCEANETLVLKGSVKSHNLRDSKNQTVMTRCKVLEVLA